MKKLVVGAYVVGHFLNDMTASLWFSFLMIFLTEVAHLSPQQAGTVMLSGQIADAIATPLIGFISDHTSTRFGKRKIWVLLGGIIVNLSFFFVFSQCLFCTLVGLSPVVVYSVLAALFNVGWAATQVSHMALIPELSPDANERTELNSARYGSCIVATLFVLGVTSLVFHYWGISYKSFGLVATISMAIGNVLMLLFLLVVPEPSSAQSQKILPATSSIQAETAQPVANVEFPWYRWFLNPAFYQVACVYTASRVCVNVNQVYLPFFLQNVLGIAEKSILAVVPAIVMLASFMTTFILRRLNSKLGRIASYAIGSLLVLVAAVPFVFVSKSTWWAVFPIAVVLGIGTTISYVTSTSMEADLVGDKVTSGAFVYGFMSFADKVTNGLFIKFLAPFTSSEPNLRILNSAIPGGAVLVGTLFALLMAPVYCLHRRSAKDASPIGSIFHRSSSRHHSMAVNEESPLAVAPPTIRLFSSQKYNVPIMANGISLSPEPGSRSSVWF